MTARLRRLSITILISGYCLLVLAGCGADDAGGPGDDPQATMTAAPSQPTMAHENLPAPVERAIAVAAGDAGVTTSAIGLIDFVEERWNDTSLGCPQPDGMYAQVVTPGYNVRLLINGHEREYHTDMADAVVRCTTLVQ